VDKKEIGGWLERIGQDLALMEAYLDQKRRLDDWHGVMDASADIRELLIMQRTLRQVMGDVDAKV
jgi:hypothetical protein